MVKRGQTIAINMTVGQLCADATEALVTGEQGLLVLLVILLTIFIDFLKATEQRFFFVV